jgi:hypothetical protein
MRLLINSATVSSDKVKEEFIEKENLSALWILKPMEGTDNEYDSEDDDSAALPNGKSTKLKSLNFLVRNVYKALCALYAS